VGASLRGAEGAGVVAAEEALAAADVVVLGVSPPLLLLLQLTRASAVGRRNQASRRMGGDQEVAQTDGKVNGRRPAVSLTAIARHSTALVVRLTSLATQSPLALALLALALGACSSYTLATREPPPMSALGPVPPGVGRICVLRPHSVAALVPAVVRDNDHLVGMTKGASYFCWLAAPGMHRVVTFYGDDADESLGTGETEEVAQMVYPGQSYWLHHDVRSVISLSVGWMDPNAASEALGDCEYKELEAVPKGQRLPVRGEVIPALPAPQPMMPPPPAAPPP
jgi:hypothetical protein